jgi:two-component SAPR family response regulator
MKPYDAQAIKKAYDKAMLVRDEVEENHVFIKTFGYFDVFVDGKSVAFTSAKSKELLALLVDRNGGVVSTEQAISVLWEGRKYDETVQSLFRKVLKALRVSLEEAGIIDILVDNRNQRSVDKTKFACDYYTLIEKGKNENTKFFGRYMEQYEWAKSTEEQISKIYNG